MVDYQISKAVKEKHHLYSQYKFTHSDADYAIYVCCQEKSAKASFDKKFWIQNLTAYPKALYGYIRERSKIKPSIGPLEKPDGSLTGDDSIKW